MRYFISILCIIVFSVELTGQIFPESITGKVSFISAQNIYVRFNSTSGISSGDTLYVLSNDVLKPALIVNNLSSVSCVCTSISSESFSIEKQIIARIKVSDINHEEEVHEAVLKETIEQIIPVDSTIKQSNQNEFRQKIKGSISAYSYSDFSNTSATNSNRFRYTLSLDARNIANSKFSIESYLSFRHKLGDWSDVKSDLFNALKIYSLSVKYNPDKNSQITLGRHINPKISSIGAMDGLQIETSINNFSIGALVGSRPDYVNYNFDINLFQYGAYLAFNTSKAKTYSESSIAFMQQTNSGITDRRFLYFQHSNSLMNNIYVFGTFEVDLYELKRDTLNVDSPQNTFNLTGLYFSLRYKIMENLSVTGSYDARKNVVYYETYKTFIDRILEAEKRQSFRLSANYRIARSMMFGLQSGYRFLKTDPHPSRNVSGYFTYSQIPRLNISLTLSATYLESNYLNGNIYGGNISRDLFQGKLHTYIGYRYVNYRFTESLFNVAQNIGEMSLSSQFLKKMTLALNYEGTFEQKNRYDRLYMQIRLRF